jgi:xanthine dehydrogenase accessory factor
MHELGSLLDRLASLPHDGAVLATLVSVDGSSYRRPGARVLFTSDGTKMGSISGGCLEADVQSRAQRVMTTGEPELITYDTTSENDLIWGVGLGCSGMVRVLLEKVPPSAKWVQRARANLHNGQQTPLRIAWKPINGTPLGTTLCQGITHEVDPQLGVFCDTLFPPLRLAIFGAGDDAQPLVRIAKELGWHVTIADPRANFATAARFPQADRIVHARATELVDQAVLTSDTISVVMTHHYVHDVPVVAALFRRTNSYLGLLGPKKRAEKILQDLASAGGVPTADQRSRFYAPVGFDLGGETPAEVALSIIAEIQAFLTGRAGGPLRERVLPIHDSLQNSALPLP